MDAATANYSDNLSAVCRGCLATSGPMKNMFDCDLLELFKAFVDVPITCRSDLVSEMLCKACEEMLKAFRLFKERCRHSDLWLREAARLNEAPITTLADASAADFSNGLGQQIQVENCLLEDRLTISITTPVDQTEGKIYLTCPHGCQKRYLKQKDLSLHLTKTHFVHAQFLVEVRYHCPFPTCHYHKDWERGKFFSGRKYLNQHLNKAHGEKREVVCGTCNLTFGLEPEYLRHLKTCNVTYVCALCNVEYKTNERLLVHLKRRHPTLHQQYKDQRKLDRSMKRATETATGEPKRAKKDADATKKDLSEYVFCDSPKRSFATQTLSSDDNIKNDVALPSWAFRGEKSDDMDRNYSTIETQTVFEDLLSLKSEQNSEDESIFFSETVSLSDIQTQTFPVEFGLSRKETITCETQTRNPSPDLSIKETQTCVCMYESPKLNFRLFDSMQSSPSSNLTSTETQTADLGRSSVRSDVMLSFNSAETQTCFEDGTEKDL